MLALAAAWWYTHFMAEISETEFLKRLRARIGKKSIRSMAAKWGISPAYLSDVLSGKRGAGDGVARPMGCEVIIRRSSVRVFIENGRKPQ